MLGSMNLSLKRMTQTSHRTTANLMPFLNYLYPCCATVDVTVVYVRVTEHSEGKTQCEF